MTPATTPTRRPSAFGLFRLWTLQQIRQLFRNPQATFFTVVFPLLFLVLFSALIKNNEVPVPGGRIGFAQYFTPTIATFAILSSCFTGLLIAVTMERDQLVLKRVRSTPLRPGIYIASRIAAVAVMGTLTTIVLFVVGMLAFGVHVYPRLLPAAIVTFLLGTATFAALGLAVSALVPNSDAAPAVANAVALPMTFISGVFFPIQGAPTWLVKIADVLPMLHLVNAFTLDFLPYTKGSGFDVHELVPLAIWGLAAALFAARRFRWEPVPGRARRGGRRQRIAVEEPGSA